MQSLRRIILVLALVVVSSVSASAQFDLSRALGAFFGAVTNTDEKQQKEAQKDAQQESQQGDKAQSPQSPLELFQQLQQQQTSGPSPFEVLAANAPSGRALCGSWLYEDAGAEFLGQNPLADMAISQVEPYAKAQVEAAGIKPGSFSVVLRRNGTGTITYKEHSLSGRYVYDEESAKIIISGSVNNVASSVSGYVRLVDDRLEVLLDAQSSLDALLKVYPELATNQTVQMVSGVLASFAGVYVCASFGAL